jgi:hypothetical protein
MDLNAHGLLAELQTLSSGEVTSALPRLRELFEAVEQAMQAGDRHSAAGTAAALAHQAINYLYEGIEAKQNGPEIKRRFAVAIRRTEGWAMASARARSDDPRLLKREVGQ